MAERFLIISMCHYFHGLAKAVLAPQQPEAVLKAKSAKLKASHSLLCCYISRQVPPCLLAPRCMLLDLVIISSGPAAAV